MDYDPSFPYLMSKETLAYCPNNVHACKQYGDKFVPITREQALDIDRRGKAAGVDILRAVVARDNADALRRAEAAIGAMVSDAPAPAPVAAAEEAPAAVETEPDRPWSAKTIKGNPPKKDLIAFLEGKGVADAAELPYDELKATAATYDWVAEHGAQ